MSDVLGHLGLPVIGINGFGFTASFASRTFVQYHDAVETTDIGRHVLGRLSDDPRVIKMSGQLIPSGLNNSAGFDLKILAAWWMMRSNQAGQAQADKDLDAYLDADIVDIFVSHWVVGLNPSKVMKLVEGFALYPISEMPDSDSKERYSQAINKFNRLDGPIPRAALCKTVQRKKLKSEGSNEISSISQDISGKIDTIISILNCTAGIFCLPWVQTSHLPENVPSGILGTSDLRWPRNDFSYQKVVDVKGLDTTLVATLFDGFTKLDENSARRISIALDRLAIAKATRDVQSSALDLGISLEMVLLAGEGEKTQIRQKFSTRASWLIGRDGPERLSLFKSFKRIYDDRSEVAHNGFSDALQKRISKTSGDYLKNHFALAERVFQRLIINGPPHCWDALVLNAEKGGIPELL